MQKEFKQSSNQRVARILTLALGATTAMWVFSYIALLFSGKTGGEVLFILGALCLPIASRHAINLKEGAWVGAISALLNLLLVGSIVGGKAPADMVASGVYWVIGLFVISILLGIIGSLFHGGLKDCKCELDWHFGFLAVASTLVFLMLITGGLVTGLEAGLAVPDWPNSYGHNMLLYPLTEMVSQNNEGVFFEHAHRLTGMFVGLTSLLLVACVWKWNGNKVIRTLAVCIFLLVCVQGLLGGLRVTGHLTLEQDRAMLSPNLWIGVVHGVVGQLIFAGIVSLSAMFSPRWKTATRCTNKSDVRWAVFLCIAMTLQLILGAAYRHMMGDELLASKATHILYTHIAVAFLVLLFAVVVGIRCMHRDNPTLKKLGITLHGLVLLQLLLGGGALVVVLINKGQAIPLYEVIVTTAHQANGALLLGASFAAFVWIKRLKDV
jgi:cytochrome c oxidase assembly protein subunit 15